MLRRCKRCCVLVSLFAFVVPFAARAAPSCARADLAIARFPLEGIAGRDWVITNSLDHDPTSPGVADYAGRRGAAALSYDGHNGIDIDVPSFRDMDRDAAV